MSLGLAFWIVMLVWIAIGLYQGGLGWAQGNAILLILLILLGWAVFGAPIR